MVGDGLGVTVVGVCRPHKGVNRGIQRGLVKLDGVGAKHGFRATFAAQLQNIQIQVVAAEAPREPRSEPPLGRVFPHGPRCARKQKDPQRGDPLWDEAVQRG